MRARLLALRDHSDLEKIAKKVIVLSLSVRQTESMIQNVLNPERTIKAPKPEPVIDPNVREIKDMLQRLLGLRVNIEDKHGRGRVIIEYARLEDFDTLAGAAQRQVDMRLFIGIPLAPAVVAGTRRAYRAAEIAERRAALVGRSRVAYHPAVSRLDDGATVCLRHYCAAPDSIRTLRDPARAAGILRPGRRVLCRRTAVARTDRAATARGRSDHAMRFYFRRQAVSSPRYPGAGQGRQAGPAKTQGLHHRRRGVLKLQSRGVFALRELSRPGRIAVRSARAV